VYGTTVGAGANSRGQCGGANAGSEEVVYSFAPAIRAPTTFCVDTSGSNFDTVLYVNQGECGAAENLACNDDAGGLQSQVEIQAVPRTSYFIFVDGFSRAGNYQLNIARGACP
jgi:hypothetical protein